MIKLLFLPGAIFLLVIFFRVVFPYISTAPWKRMLDSATYHRHREEFDKSDKFLEKAIVKYPDKPQVYLDYFLNHSDAPNLKKRFDILYSGYERTKDVILRFFIGSTYLEHGMFDKAGEFLDNPECREYMLQRGITLIPELYYELGQYEKAEQEYEAYYRELFKDERDFDKLLEELSPQDLIMLALIRREAGGNYLHVMGFAPKTSVHSDMSWRDLLSAYHDKLKNLKPAVTSITGDPGDFNKKRNQYFDKRIKLIESYL